MPNIARAIVTVNATPIYVYFAISGIAIRKAMTEHIMVDCLSTFSLLLMMR